MSKVIRVSDEVYEAISAMTNGSLTLGQVIEVLLDPPQPAEAAIAYALNPKYHDNDPGTQVLFLELWNNAEFDAIREDWDNVPEKVFYEVDEEI